MHLVYIGMYFMTIHLCLFKILITTHNALEFVLCNKYEEIK